MNLLRVASRPLTRNGRRLQQQQQCWVQANWSVTGAPVREHHVVRACQPDNPKNAPHVSNLDTHQLQESVWPGLMKIYSEYYHPCIWL